MDNINENIMKQFQLTDEEYNNNIDEIFAELSLNATPTEKKSFILIGGQAGSGKSALVAKEYKDLNGNAIIIDQDELRTKFPKDKYKQIHDNYTDREEFLILKPYILNAVFDIIRRAQNGGYNIILESALRSTGSFMKQLISTTQELRENGYNAKLSVMAVPEIEANISMLTRYCYYLKKYGECRRNTRLDSSAIPKLRANLEMLDQQNIFDDIMVYVRGKGIDTLPVSTYSKSENNELTPLQAYDISQKNSIPNTVKTFGDRYNELRRILTQYNKSDKLETLNDIKNAFEQEEVK